MKNSYSLFIAFALIYTVSSTAQMVNYENKNHQLKPALTMEYNQEDSMPFCHLYRIQDPPTGLIRQVLGSRTGHYGHLASYSLSESKKPSDKDACIAEDNMYNNRVKARLEHLKGFKETLFQDFSNELFKLNTALSKHLNFFKYGNDKAFNPFIVIYIKDYLSHTKLSDLKQYEHLYALKRYLSESESNTKLYDFVESYIEND